MDTIIELLTDVKHWIGWILTVLIITIVFHYLGIHLHKPWYFVTILLGLVVVVDLFKHKVHLQ